MKIFFSGIAVTLIVLVSFLSCTYDKGTLIPLNICPDTTNVSFNAKVRPLLQANCFSCHGNGSRDGGVSLDTYDQVKELVINGRLLGSITHSSGFAPMPIGAGKLNDCNITAIRTWILEGAPNN